MTNPPLDPAETHGPVEDLDEYQDQDSEPSTMAPPGESPTDPGYEPDAGTSGAPD
jgi:hypothetical protein